MHNGKSRGSSADTKQMMELKLAGAAFEKL